MARKKKSRTDLKDATKVPEQESSDFYDKERLDDLLAKIKRSIELAKELKGPLPEKIWMKQQFAIGVNDVTRVLERMPHDVLTVQSTSKPVNGPLRRAPLVPLQAVIVALDCNPRWLVKHIPSLSSSRQVPVISIKDSKRGSLRLGELVNLKTAMVIGVKAKGSKINEAIDAILSGDDTLLEDISKTP
ncbi:Ribonuclease P protein [Dioscorea alata]|uniref:Ribonuclease P protein n=1 Tax=Dioscorea alata TaxID=55571 RepID=A0ACB7VPG3_DIOAL|nr:Ribonuclease P protein [Dioscorea alata]